MFKIDYLDLKNFIEKEILTKVLGEFTSGVITILAENYSNSFGVLYLDNNYVYGTLQDEKIDDFVKPTEILNSRKSISLCIRVFTQFMQEEKHIDEIWTVSIYMSKATITPIYHDATFTEKCILNKSGTEIFKGFDGSVISPWD